MGISIVKNYLELKERIPPNVKLIAVSKFRPVEMITDLYGNTGHLDFGENRAQELNLKYIQLPKDIRWHFLGHLQTNKIKFISPFVHLIHGIDSFKVLEEVDKEARKNNRIMDCLLQFHIAKEESKFGFDYNEVVKLLSSAEFKAMGHIRIKGVMGMATFTKDFTQVGREFHGLKRIFDELKAGFFTTDPDFSELSMGMSGDYQIAIEEGSTMIRIGSSIFGER